jgi:hypothetical protein
MWSFDHQIINVQYDLHICLLVFFIFESDVNSGTGEVHDNLA